MYLLPKELFKNLPASVNLILMLSLLPLPPVEVRKLDIPRSMLLRPILPPRDTTTVLYQICHPPPVSFPEKETEEGKK